MPTDDPLSYRIGRGAGDALYALGAGFDPLARQQAEEQRRAQANRALQAGRNLLGNITSGFEGTPAPPKAPSAPPLPGGDVADPDATSKFLMAGDQSNLLRNPPQLNITAGAVAEEKARQAQAARVPQESPIRVQRNAEGRITSASNIEGAQGDVFPSSAPSRGTFSSPGAVPFGDERDARADDARRMFEENTSGQSRAENARDEASIAANRLLADDPLMRERFGLQQQYAQIGIAGEKERQRQEARYVPFDQAVDQETQAELADLDSHPDGMPVPDASGRPGPPMTPQMREQIRKAIIDNNRAQKRGIRERAFRAPAATETDMFGG